MEILNICCQDIDLSGCKVSVIGKGGKKRIVPLNPIAEKAVRELLQRLTSDGFLFHSRTGNTLSHKQGAFQSAVVAAKIEDLHFHDLRHTFSTRLRQFTDAFTLKECSDTRRFKQQRGTFRRRSQICSARSML
jgi:integrase